jgi:hypothetical protein
MQISVNYQYSPAPGVRPIDEGVAVDIQLNDAGGSFAFIPNVGDYVQISPLKEGDPSFAGKVRSRYFVYIAAMHCHVNIVVEETTDDFGLLIKE